MKIISLLLLASVQFCAWSQDWTTSYKDATISIEYAKISHVSPSDGINHERMIFKYSNFTNQEVIVNFERKLAYNGAEISSTKEQKYSIIIPSNSALQYSDEEKHNKLYYCFMSDNKATIKKNLTGFEIINIEIK